MDPIRRAGVVAFLDWLNRNHPEITSLRSLDRDAFLRLATSYEQSKGLRISPSHAVYRKWESTHWYFMDCRSDEEALSRLT